MRLSVLLRLQLVYVAMGTGFNVVSLLVGILGAEPLTSTKPYLGLIAMLVYASFLLAAYKERLLFGKWQRLHHQPRYQKEQAQHQNCNRIQQLVYLFRQLLWSQKE